MDLRISLEKRRRSTRTKWNRLFTNTKECIYQRSLLKLRKTWNYRTWWNRGNSLL